MDLTKNPPSLPTTARIVVDLETVTPEEFASLVLLVKTAAEGLDPNSSTWVLHRHDFEARTGAQGRADLAAAGRRDTRAVARGDYGDPGAPSARA